MKQIKMSVVLTAICLAVALVQAGCCTKKSGGEPKNKSPMPWGGQGKSGTGALPGGLNDKR